MINEQIEGITPTDISFFENLIKLEELTGFIESNKLEAGSPQVGSIINSATSVYSTINSLLPRLSEAGKTELQMGQDLYNDIMGVNAATLQDVGGDAFSSIAGGITKAWDGLLGLVGIKSDTEEETSSGSSDPGDTAATEVPATGTTQSSEPTLTSSEPEQSTPTSEPVTPTGGPAPRPTVNLNNTPGAMKGKTGYATRYLPKQSTEPNKTAGGPTYYVRMGPGRYQPASQTDLDSGTQLFMKNPNPALRMVYPYVKVESMIKKARRATRA
jgi:hypothetical protein